MAKLAIPAGLILSVFCSMALGQQPPPTTKPSQTVAKPELITSTTLAGCGKSGSKGLVL
jgi:hypothetical protein